MTSVQRFDHIVLTVEDLEESARFYQRTLGMEARPISRDRIAVHFGHQKINLQEVDQLAPPTAEQPRPGSGDLCLVTLEPLDRVVAELEAEGVEILEGPVTKEGALGPITSVYFRDLDGNLLEVASYGGPVEGGGFPDALENVSTARLLEVYDAGPGRLRGVVEGLELEELRARPLEGKWSILEIVLHTVDSEIVGLGRMRTALAEPGFPFHMYSQDRWTEALDHNAAGPREMEAGLTLLSALRASMSLKLRALEPDEWQRTGRHRELRVLTVRQLLELYADHVERHVTQILERRRLLDRPLEIEPLLPRPLY